MRHLQLRSRSLEKAIDVPRHARAAFDDVGPVEHERSCFSSRRFTGETRQPVLQRELRDQAAVMPRFAMSSGVKCVTPVTLPPGRARLAMIPSSTG